MDVTTNNRELEGLYVKAFPAVAHHVAKMGGNIEEAKDIFHDALILYMEKEESVQNPTAYLLGIARHLWTRRFNEIIKMYNPEGTMPADIDEDYQEAAAPGLMRLLKTTGQKCMELLSAFYYEKMDMEKLAERFGFSRSRSATVQKFKCLEKVKETVKQKSLQYEDFME